MDLDDIRLLQEVVKLGSLQRAAAKLGVPRSTLRRRLENLAVHVGSEIVVPTSVGVQVTPAGKVVLEHGRVLLENYTRMVSSAKDASAIASGSVRIIVPVGMPDEARVGIMNVFRQQAPGLCLDELEYAEPLDHLDEPFDVLFHFGAPPDRGGWFSRTLRRLRIVPVASQEYLDEAGRPATPEDLRKHRLLAWRVGGVNPCAWPLWAGGTIAVEPSVCSRNGQLMHRAAQAGEGLLLGDPNSELMAGGAALVPVLEDTVGFELTFRALSPLRIKNDRRAGALVDTVQRFLDSIMAMSAES